MAIATVAVGGFTSQKLQRLKPHVVTKAQPAKQAGATSAALGERPVPHVVKSFTSR